jgi:hypothetical protein
MGFSQSIFFRFTSHIRSSHGNLQSFLSSVEWMFGTWVVRITINEVRIRKRRGRRIEMISLGYTPELAALFRDLS